MGRRRLRACGLTRCTCDERARIGTRQPCGESAPFKAPLPRGAERVGDTGQPHSAPRPIRALARDAARLRGGWHSAASARAVRGVVRVPCSVGQEGQGVMAPKSPPVRASATSPRLGSDPAPGAVAPFTTVHARSGAVRRRSFARLLESRASLPPRAVANRSRHPPGGAQLRPRGYRDGWRRARVSPDRRHRAQACRACRDGHPAGRAEWRAAPGPRDQAQP